MTGNHFARHVICCKSGQRALEMLQNIRPDLVLLDIGMPGMDGIELLQVLREKYGEQLPVMMLTTSNHPSDLERVAQLKANYYLVKPLTHDKLAKMLERCF